MGRFCTPTCLCFDCWYVSIRAVSCSHSCFERWSLNDELCACWLRHGLFLSPLFIVASIDARHWSWQLSSQEACNAKASSCTFEAIEAATTTAGAHKEKSEWQDTFSCPLCQGHGSCYGESSCYGEIGHGEKTAVWQIQAWAMVGWRR